MLWLKFLRVLILGVTLGFLLTGCEKTAPSVTMFQVQTRISDIASRPIYDVKLVLSDGQVIYPENGYWYSYGIKSGVTITPLKEGWIFNPSKVEVKSKVDIVIRGMTPLTPVLPGFDLYSGYKGFDFSIDSMVNDINNADLYVTNDGDLVAPRGIVFIPTVNKINELSKLSYINDNDKTKISFWDRPDPLGYYVMRTREGKQVGIFLSGNYKDGLLYCFHIREYRKLD